MTCFLIREYDILPKKELHRSLQVLSPLGDSEQQGNRAVISAVPSPKTCPNADRPIHHAVEVCHRSSQLKASEAVNKEHLAPTTVIIAYAENLESSVCYYVDPGGKLLGG